jgi:hypothetical protein
MQVCCRYRVINSILVESSAIHEAIIDNNNNWQLQNKMKKPEKIRTILDEKTTTSGDLKCHCGNVPTGPSRGKSEKVF